MARPIIKNAQDAIDYVVQNNIDNVKLGIFDVDGVCRGKYLNRDKFISAVKNGFAFCDVVLGWDSNDQLYDNVKFTGWHTAYPDAPARIDPTTMRLLPDEGNIPFFIGEFADKAEPLCPRGILKRVLKKADDMGLKATAAAEFEFFVFEETPDSVREKNYKNLKSLTPGYFGYSVLRSGVHSGLYHDLLEMCRDMDMEIEGLHTETGPGVLEAAIKYDEALAAADKAALFKTFTKIMMQQRGLMATFMARWSNEWPGQSGHLHMSLAKKDGESVFFDESKTYGMSDTMRHFVGGQQKLLPDILAMISPTVNSYTRLVPGLWAPTSATWGYENRTTALRVIGGNPKSQRVEVRIAAADINPYIAIAAGLGAGLWGIENKIEPEAAISGNAYAYEEKNPARRLPTTLTDAAYRLMACEPAKEIFGDDFIEHYAQTRIWEDREARKAITDWQLARYFEII